MLTVGGNSRAHNHGIYIKSKCLKQIRFFDRLIIYIFAFEVLFGYTWKQRTIFYL